MKPGQRRIFEAAAAVSIGSNGGHSWDYLWERAGWAAGYAADKAGEHAKQVKTDKGGRPARFDFSELTPGDIRKIKLPSGDSRAWDSLLVAIRRAVNRERDKGAVFESFRVSDEYCIRRVK